MIIYGQASECFVSISPL